MIFCMIYFLWLFFCLFWLVLEMNQFFVAEARRQALLSHGQVIIRHLQNICDELAADVLTGKQ